MAVLANSKFAVLAKELGAMDLRIWQMLGYHIKL